MVSLSAEFSIDDNNSMASCLLPWFIRIFECRILDLSEISSSPAESCLSELIASSGCFD